MRVIEAFDQFSGMIGLGAYAKFPTCGYSYSFREVPFQVTPAICTNHILACYLGQ